MDLSEPLPKLRMAAPETAEETAHRVERERRAADLQRESNLDHSLAPFRVGSVGYLNAVPLTRGLEEEVIYTTPAKLAEMLERDELDAGLVSVVEALFNDRYDILDGIAIASLGEVKSVLLAHRKPLSEVTEVYCDTASLTSVQLLRVLLAERGLKPEFKPLASYDYAALPDYAMLIGDPALDFVLAPHEHEIWDLGAAWFELTGLPSSMPSGLCAAASRMLTCGVCFARRATSAWTRSIPSSARAPSTITTFGKTTWAGISTTTLVPTKSAAW